MKTAVLKATACALPLAVLSADPAHAAGNAFNPDMSLILAGTYGALSSDPAGYAIPGFNLPAESGPGERGFSLGESELVLSSNIDNQFFGYLTAALAPSGEVAVEEAYIQTLGLGAGLTLRAGRFRSGIGYLNGQHPHAWDFVDAALPYRALLGGGYGDDGVQLKWLAPTDTYLELGAESLRGANYPAGGEVNKGRGAVTAFAHVGGDIGASHSWRAGLSQLRAQAVARESGDPLDPDLFSGDSVVSVADFVWKWAPQGNATRTNFKLQGEYLRRKEDGSFTVALPAANTDAYSANQSGWYLQAVYQFMPRWRVGLRYDRLDTASLAAGSNAAYFDTQGHDPRRASAMVDFSNSEFSRVRLQFNRDQSQLQADNQVFVQYLMSLGAHGAHQF